MNPHIEIRPANKEAKKRGTWTYNADVTADVTLNDTGAIAEVEHHEENSNRDSSFWCQDCGAQLEPVER